MHPQIQQHPASVDAYLRHGWALVPIPSGTKGPRTPGWQRKENCLRQGAQLPPGTGIGLAHAYSGTMALDIDRWTRASEELAAQGIDLDALYNAPDAVVIDSGNPGHGKLLYAMPFGMTLPSKKLIASDVFGNRYNYLDFRCATSSGLTMQDVLPPTMHPETQQPYRWAGGGHWSRLPLIPSTLLEYWQSLIDADKQRSISTTDINTSWDEIRQALDHISPDCSRDEWVQIGMALHWAGTQTDQIDQAVGLWDEWSRGSETKYKGQQDILRAWVSFRTDRANAVTLGTLFHYATQAGWSRPLPDASELFSSTAPIVAAPSAPIDPVQILSSLSPPAPDLDLNLLPEILRIRAEEVATHIGCDPLVPALAGLAAVCSAVDARTRLELMPGFSVPPVLWIMTVGEPADKKSPGSRPMFDVLKEIEREDRPDYARKLLGWEAIEAQHHATKKAFLTFTTSPEFLLGEAPPSVVELPEQPTPLRLTVSDITSQKLVRTCAERPRGVLCYLDEMNSWVNKICDPRSGEDRSAWTVSYESQWYEMDRVGGGSIHCDNLAVSVYGNIQPRVLRENIHALSRDGLLQRFLPIVLRGDRTKLGHPIPDHLTHRAQYDQAVRSVYGLPAMTYRLSDEAYKSYRAFQHWYEGKKRDERLLQAEDSYMTAFGKLEGLCGRIALMWHLIEEPYTTEVSRETMDKAIQFVTSYVVPVLRYTYGVVAGLSEDPLDAWLMRHIIWIADTETTVTMRALGQSARRRLGPMSVWQRDNAITDAMVTLEQAGWVVRIEDKPATRHVTWAIDPRICTLYPDYRTEVIKAKQRRVDEMYGECHTWKDIRDKLMVRGYDPETMDEKEPQHDDSKDP